MKKSVYARIPVELEKELNSRENKPKILEEAIGQLDFKCPHCHRPWVDSPSDENRERIAVRIKPELAEKIMKIGNTSRYLCVALMVFLGYCPVCGQRKK